MTVGELKTLLDGIDDHVEVLIPVNMDEADGLFYSPCFEMSGEIEANVDGLEDLDFITDYAKLTLAVDRFSKDEEFSQEKSGGRIIQLLEKSFHDVVFPLTNRIAGLDPYIHHY